MKKLISTLILCALALTSQAQDRPTQDRPSRDYIFASPYDRYVTFTLSAQYGVAVPLGTQTGYIDRISPANAVLHAQWQFPQRFALGVQTGYQYNQMRMPRQTVQLNDAVTVSAVQTRTLTVIPALATASYHFADPGATFRPYVEIGAGGAYVDYTNFYGLLTDQKTAFRGAVAPAVGVNFFRKREGHFGAGVRAQYQNVFFKYNEINNAQSLILSAGLTFRWY